MKAVLLEFGIFCALNIFIVVILQNNTNGFQRGYVPHCFLDTLYTRSNYSFGKYIPVHIDLHERIAFVECELTLCL